MLWVFAAASDYAGVWVALISSGLLFLGNLLINRKQEESKEAQRRDELKDELNEVLERRLKSLREDYNDLQEQHNELKSSHQDCERQIAAQEEEITALEFKHQSLKEFVRRRLGDVPEDS